MKIRVYRTDYIAEILLIPHKLSGKYSFVNLTKGHICPCTFDTVEDALKDLEDRKKKNLLISYEFIEE